MSTTEPPHGMPYPHSEPVPSGFTAVNGESHALSSFRPAEAPNKWRSLSGKDSPGENITVSTSLPTHGWRPDVREVTADYDASKHASDSASKRKRSDTEDEFRPGNADVNGLDSAKRRLMSNILDSAVDLTSPDADVDRRPLATGQTSRAPSPINRGPPPPEVSSSAEARLVESARQFQQAQRAETVDQASPPYDHHERTEQQYNGDDQAQDDSADAKKRKRHFTNRTKTGCHTCRGRKKKCDEKKPLCANCERGGFQCAGYGAKPADYKAPGQSRTVMPQPQLQQPPQLQPSALSYPEQQPPGPTSYWAHGEPGRHYVQQPQVEAGRTHSHWGRLLDQNEPKRASSRDTWTQPSYPNDHSHPPPPPQGPYYPPERPPLPDYLNLSHPQHLLPPPQHHPSLPPPHLYPDSWAPHPAFPTLRHAPASVNGSNNTHHSSSSSGSRAITEKEKMFRGMSYLHCVDPQLIRDRERCVQALFNYNKAANPNEGTSADHRASYFTAVLEPRKRQQADQKDHAGPVGEVGVGTLVESPFKCDYGYHIHLGKEVFISADCYLQDGGGIWIGDRTIVGSRVQFLTMAGSVDTKMRGGSSGWMKAGMIRIGDDVFIGAGATVLPYVTVGNGSVVGAGSVVTKDVPENTVVAGNPAKYVRSIDTNPANHRAHDINRQEEAMVKHMADYVDNGWKPRSPR